MLAGLMFFAGCFGFSFGFLAGAWWQTGSREDE